MVRHREGNTIISYHHDSELQKTTARRLRSLVQRTGDSVYWQKLYAKSKDPTFVFLAAMWYALYAWDEALEVLYAHLSEQLVRLFSRPFFVLNGSSRKPPMPRLTLVIHASCTSCKLIFCTINNSCATSKNLLNLCETHPTRPWTMIRFWIWNERPRKNYWCWNQRTCWARSSDWRNRGRSNLIG